MPVKELERRPVESVRLAKVRLKGDKLVERDELGSILALVEDLDIKTCIHIYMMKYTTWSRIPPKRASVSPL